uniref:DEAD/DEAH box helicase family protein n=1 Tax=Gemmiger formicilis TaxID=745368 RepID=UPI004028ACE3
MDEVFHLKAPFQPTGDQPQAIEALMQGIHEGDDAQTLLGVTGSGKTFTMANIIARCNRPTLILEPNKTLASQICTEMRGFFPDDAVEYFVSYYDYYQPEAYIPSTDTYIEKDSAINDEIDRLRHSATAALSEQRNVIIVASVSCIYSLGDPIDYRSMVISLRPGMEMERDALCKRLVTLQYERNDINFIRNKFRVHGDTVDIYLAYMSDLAIRVEFFGDEIDRIIEFNPVTGAKQNVVKHVAIFPASHYIVSAEKKAKALEKIRAECDQQVKQFTT